MKRMAGVVVLLLVVLAASSCGGNGSNMQPSPSPSPAPSPGTSSVPSITSISPTSAVAGTQNLVLIVDGDNLDGSQAVWRANNVDTPLTSTLVSGNQLIASVPAGLLVSPMAAQVLVEDFGIEQAPGPASVPKSFSVLGGTAVFPTEVTLGPQRTQQFVATSDGSSTEVTWSIQESPGGGSISSSGLYTVPQGTGVFHVVATPMADPSSSAIATVTVVSSGFTPTGSMNKARSGHTAVLLKNGKVLILDGQDGSAELFDPATGTFTQTGSLGTPRAGFATILLANGKVLVVGGYGTNTNSPRLPTLNAAELYDPSTGTFTPTGNMVDVRVDPSGTLLSDGRALIAGGVGSEGPSCAIASAELYDPSTGAFSIAGSMATARVGHTATRLLSGEVLIVGGRNGCAPDAPDDPPWDPLFGELFGPATATFTTTSDMSTTRIGHTATRLLAGRVLLLGGVPAIQNLHEQLPDPAYAEIYDPVTGDFSPVANLSMLQDCYTATLMTNGEVLIAGGEEAGLSLASASLIDVVNQTVTPTGSLVTARQGHTATLLNDGRVLVTGGTDSSGKALASAELYRTLQ